MFYAAVESGKQGKYKSTPCLAQLKFKFKPLSAAGHIIIIIIII
jgi:hypothetical protein